MPQQYLAMAFSDTDSPVRKCHPVNLLCGTKQIRQTGNGFLSPCHAISIILWFHVGLHEVKSLPPCTSIPWCMVNTIFFLKESIFRARDQTESQDWTEQGESRAEVCKKHQNNRFLYCMCTQTRLCSPFFFSDLAVPSCMCCWGKVPYNYRWNALCEYLLNVRAEGDEATP